MNRAKNEGNSVRRECPSHIVILSEKHLHGVIQEYAGYFNKARPHQGIGQAIPIKEPPDSQCDADSRVLRFPVLVGLHHDYRKTA